MMLGLADVSVWLAYVLSIASALLCVGWGIWRWNHDDAAPDEPAAEVRQWAAAEVQLESKC